MGGCASCRGLVTVHTDDARAGQVDYTIEYCPDGALALIAHNGTAEPQAVKVVWRSQAFHYTLPANTSATFRWAQP